MVVYIKGQGLNESNIDHIINETRGIMIVNAAHLPT